MIVLCFSHQKVEKIKKNWHLKWLKMSQNWLQCIFGVFSFHAGVYFTKYYLKLNNFGTAYHDLT